MLREREQRPALVRVGGVELQIVAEGRRDQDLRERRRDLCPGRLALGHIPKAELHLLHRLAVFTQEHLQIIHRCAGGPQERDHFLIGIIVAHPLQKRPIDPTGVIPIAVIHRVITSDKIEQAQAGIERDLRAQERLSGARIRHFRAIDRNGIVHERKRHHLLRDRPQGAPGRWSDHVPLLGCKRKRSGISFGNDLARIEQGPVQIQSDQLHKHLLKQENPVFKEHRILLVETNGLEPSTSCV